MENYTSSKGIPFRWLNNAGFELELPGGKHLLVDPWLDNAEVFPIEISSFERIDYVLLTHIHFDHADSIQDIQEHFPNAKIFVGALSCEALCKSYHLNVEKMYLMRGGESYEFDDVKIEGISGRHTESQRGNYYNCGGNTNDDGTPNLPMWYGWMEMLNYRITTADGSRIVVWGGMTTEEQCFRMSKYKDNDIAFVHVSPKQDPKMFVRLIQSINAHIVVPHHYDLWDKLFKAHPELLKDAPLPPDKVNEQYILGNIRKLLESECPHSRFVTLEHQRWYTLFTGIE